MNSLMQKSIHVRNQEKYQQLAQWDSLREWGAQKEEKIPTWNPDLLKKNRPLKSLFISLRP